MRIKIIFIMLVSLCISMVFCSFAMTQDVEKHNYIPECGYVPNEATAIKIAVAVWEPIYGIDKIKNEKPYIATLRDNVWYVSGSLPEGWLGGVAEAEIDKKTGRVLRISHGK
ncbi:MAG: YbbC/YhhH family protein [Candidatus Auribacterota bacterium]|nr:YbbC/YhhH family protein [Candidatus Auribacterota bacterium]